MNGSCLVASLLFLAQAALSAGGTSALGQTSREPHDVVLSQCDICPNLYDELRGWTWGIRKIGAHLADRARVAAAPVRDEEVYGYLEDECGDAQLVPASKALAAPAEPASSPAYFLSGHDPQYDAIVYGKSGWVQLQEVGSALAEPVVTAASQLAATTRELASQPQPLATVACYCSTWLDEMECAGYPVRYHQWVVRIRNMELAQAEPDWEASEAPRWDDWCEYECMGFTGGCEEIPDRDATLALEHLGETPYGRSMLLAVAGALDELGIVLQDASRQLTLLAQPSVNVSSSRPAAQR